MEKKGKLKIIKSNADANKLFEFGEKWQRSGEAGGSGYY